MAKHWIALVAIPGAGKGHLVKTVKTGYPHLKVTTTRYSDPLREILVNILGVEMTRKNLQAIGEALRNAFKDDGLLSRTLKKRMEEIDADIVFLDGLRKPGEAEVVKQLGGKLVFISASPEQRYRNRKRDPDNVGEDEMTWEEFQQRDRDPAEATIQHVGETMADVVIENNGTEQFDKKIGKFIDELCPKLI